AQKHIHLSATFRTHLPFNHHAQFQETRRADPARRRLKNDSRKFGSFRLPEKYRGERRRVHNHFGRPFSSYRSSAWSIYGPLLCPAARFAIRSSSSTVAADRRFCARSKLSRKASVTARVILTPVISDIAAARRW